MNFQEIPEKLKNKIVEQEGHWLWTGGRFKKGYACVFLPGYSQRKGHRLMWELAQGRPPEHLQVAHTCRHKHCINPAHLKLAPNKENSADKQWLNRPEHWLTLQQKEALYQQYMQQGMTYPLLAAKTGYHCRTIQNAIRDIRRSLNLPAISKHGRVIPPV